MTNNQPNVVSKQAAEFVRACVFDSRNSEVIDPATLVGRMLAAGHGIDFPDSVRKRRLRTWVLQVFRRLHRHGWLHEPSKQGWPTTAALRASPDPRALARKAPRRPATPKSPPPPPPPDSWEQFIQDWVFRHRQSTFNISEVVAAVVQRGFVPKEPGALLQAARNLAERELGIIEVEGLIRFRKESDDWEPTDLLRTWPVA